MSRGTRPIPLLVLCLVWPGAGAAQSVWSETTVTVGEPTAEAPATIAPAIAAPEGPTLIAPGDPGTTGATHTLPEHTQSVQDLPGPLDYDAVIALNHRAAQATVPVRVTLAPDPLLWPPERVVEGVAVLVHTADGRRFLVTTFGLVEGATRIELDWQGHTLTAEPIVDARYGLAVLEPERALRNPPAALPLLHVEATQPVELFSFVEGSVGAALGAGEAQYAFYQVNTVAVTMGYPLVNRRGELVGIGSHRYPVDPRLTLSVPGAMVEDFLESLE